MTEEKKKQKKPTALKRTLQANKRNQKNNRQKSKVKSAIKNFTDAIEKKETKEILSKKLNLIFSLIDKAVKNNIFKKNKANRLKSKYFIKFNTQKG